MAKPLVPVQQVYQEKYILKRAWEVQIWTSMVRETSKKQIHTYSPAKMPTRPLQPNLMQGKRAIDSKYSLWIVGVRQKLDADMPAQFCESTNPNWHGLPVTSDFELI